MLRSYDPSKITCGTVQQSYTENDKCDHLLQRIPANVAPPMVWGPRGQNVLPYGWALDSEYSPLLSLPPFNMHFCIRVIALVITIVDFKCCLMVWGESGHNDVADTMTLFEVWTAGILIASMCSRYGWAGKFNHAGECPFGCGIASKSRRSLRHPFFCTGNNERLWVLIDSGAQGLSENPNAGNRTVQNFHGSAVATQR